MSYEIRCIERNQMSYEIRCIERNQMSYEITDSASRKERYVIRIPNQLCNESLKHQTQIGIQEPIFSYLAPSGKCTLPNQCQPLRSFQELECNQSPTSPTYLSVGKVLR